MQLNKEDVLKSIRSFIGANNELAVKEATHQIKVFEVIFQKEIESFQEKGEENESGDDDVSMEEVVEMSEKPRKRGQQAEQSFEL